MDTRELETLFEAILFYRGEPVTVADLAKAAGVNAEEVREALAGLATTLEGRGLRLIREGEHAALATAPAAAAIIEKMRRDELEGPLGKAGLETLAIVIFQGPVSRADIEYVRGVNCTAILRTLMMRGLVERIENSKDARSFLYRATTELPAALGVGSLANLPGYDSMRGEIAGVVQDRATESTEEPHQE